MPGNTKNTAWDPLRKQSVVLTPEERVRQWFIGVLHSNMNVPLHMMGSEVAMNMGQKKFRADIVVYDRKAAPAMVVECKRPEVELTVEVLEQAIRYNMVLGVRFLAITNGTGTCIFRKEGGKFVQVDHLPAYDEIIEND